MHSFFLKKNTTKPVEAVLKKEIKKILNSRFGFMFLEKGDKVMSYTKHPYHDPLVSAYTPNIIYSNERMNQVREVMRKRQCGFALFRVKEDTICQSKRLTNYAEDIEGKDSSKLIIAPELLEPVKMLQHAPPL
ncbi:hypothetical protein DGG96_17935 [Legionella qingyii]|uniref:Uncharacterized protein n=1 Tax=Legionella qingyii TaxID=2184757 RepID=A0A317U0D3_9GAMM|nr:hypothetical protein [Legionella qingyii]PWY54257.1 hypothetical protein DGG96_17935 [Legionella qingyii]RUR20133.1 hypothetical protein ELY20_15125 [Legionella qingyii]RUR22395.1 hypothetical protein ELY16_14830 [Legionella qingyii]